MTVTKFGPRSEVVMEFLDRISAVSADEWVAFGTRLLDRSREDREVLGFSSPPAASAAVVSALQSAINGVLHEGTVEDAEMTIPARGKAKRSARYVIGAVAFPEQYSEEKKAVLIDQYAALGLDLAPFLAEEE